MRRLLRPRSGRMEEDGLAGVGEGWLGPVGRLEKLRLRLIRSAGSSPLVTRRPLRIPTTAEWSDGIPPPPISPASLPPTPAVLRKKAHLSRKQKIWKSLKRHTMGLRGNSQLQDDEDPRLSRSQPDLANHRSRTTDATPPSPATHRAKLKGIIRRGSVTEGGSESSMRLKDLRRDSGGHHVGFASSKKKAKGGPESPPQKEVEVSSPEHGTGDKPFVTFLLHVGLSSGRDLVIRDASGTSDPYVKFKYRSKLVYKSNTIFKNLNPTWDESFDILIEDPTSPIDIEMLSTIIPPFPRQLPHTLHPSHLSPFPVFDYDRFAMDDFMGSGSVDLSQFRFWSPSELKVMLGEEGSEQYMGFLNLTLSIAPQTQEEKDQFLKKTVRTSSDSAKKPPPKASQIWSSMVNITLVEGKNFLPTEFSPSAPLPDPYAKFKLGSEKHKTKVAAKTLDPKWLERFDMHVFDDSTQTLEITVLDKRKDLFMGRCTIDLAKLEHEIPHQCWWELEDEAGAVYLQITISGTHGNDTISDLGAADPAAEAQALDALSQQYSVVRTLSDMKDVGQLRVKVFKAQGLASADIGGKSDPFCVLELVNARLQTHTEYKTLNPEWNKIFTFSVKDIHSSLEVTIYDEDPNKKAEFLGKVSIPLLKIKNGEKRWYALKDRKLRKRAKGQILMELDVEFNPVRASVRTFNPREIKFIPAQTKFKKQVFLRSVNRLKEFGQAAAEGGAFLKSCWNWESPSRSVLSYVGFCVGVYLFELYMLPLCLLLLFVKGAVFRAVAGSFRHAPEADEYFDTDEEDDNVDDKKGGGGGKPVSDWLTGARNLTRSVHDGLHRFSLPEPPLPRSRSPSRPDLLDSSGGGLCKNISLSSGALDSLDETLSPSTLISAAIQRKREFAAASKELRSTPLSSLVRSALPGSTASQEEKRSLKDRLNLMQDTLVQVQDVLEMVAAMFERVKNTFNFTTPFLSWLAIVVLGIGTVGLYFIPLRYLLLVWGTNKWTKKLRNPNAMENNELLDFLSRVPSDTEIRLYGEFRPDPVDRASMRRDPRLQQQIVASN